jgi:hypothetical protein
VAPQVFDVTDDGHLAETYIPKLEGLDLVEYKRRVESVLRDHFAENPTLQRIRTGKSVRDDELEELARLVLEVDDKANVKHLVGARPETRRSLLTVFRGLVGHDAAAVEQASRRSSTSTCASRRSSSASCNCCRTHRPERRHRARAALRATVHDPPCREHGRPLPRAGDVDELLTILSISSPSAPRRPTGPPRAGIMSTLTTQLKSDIDKLWDRVLDGGITNPLTVIEQISFLMFARLLDVMETTGERKAERLKKPFKVASMGRMTHAAGRTSSRRTPSRCCASCATRSSALSAS